MKNITILAIFLFISAFYSKAIAQSGGNDHTFNPSDYNCVGANYSVLSIAAQSDGKIIIGGRFTTYNGITKIRVARLNADGTLDASFNIGTGANAPVNSISIQSDGKIIIGGEFTSFNGIARNYIARLNVDGSLDASFDPGSGANGFVYTTTIQSDGKIIAGGGFTTYNGTASNYIVRLNANGTLDAAFNTGIGANATVRTIALQSDGKIIMAGDFTSFNGITRSSIARLNANGALDASFDPGSGTNATVRTTTIQSDGKIIIGGDFTTFNGTARNRIARLTANGALDASFDPGSGANNSVYSTTIQSDGKIIIGGDFTSYNGTTKERIARLSSSGTLDATFSTVSGPNITVLAANVQNDGRIIIVGNFTNFGFISRFGIARLISTGSLDFSFNSGAGANDGVSTISIQNDGKIIIGGQFTHYNGTEINHIARINSDGTLDATFDPGSGTNGTVRTTTIQSDGKIIIGGSFTTFNGTVKNRIARLTANGTLDASFDPESGGTVNEIAVQNDGKIIIVGSFTTINGASRYRIARLFANGTLDDLFDDSDANNSVYATAIQSDGKIIIGGSFTAVSGMARNRIARLNGDDSMDAWFDAGSGANGIVYTIAIQSDGKIIIGGEFTSFNGIARNYIARLNGDGSLDATFDTGTGTNGTVNTISIQSDGKIIIGGHFTSYNGIVRKNIARINANGSLDTTFDPGSGAGGGLNFIGSTAIQSDGKIIVGGGFSAYNGTDRNNIARVCVNCLNTYSSIIVSACNNYIAPDGQIYISSGIKTAYISNAMGCDSIITIDLTISSTPPSAAGTISGNAIVCPGQNAVIYSVPAITNATSYTWTLPTGATGTSTTNSITVNYGTSAVSGNITVKGTNSCGNGTESSLAITVNPLPVAAGTITGTTIVCQGQSSVTYTVPTITNATSYTWTLPTDATGASTTNSITVNYGTSAVSGNITVKGNNACGSGIVSTLAITVNPLPVSAGTITGTSPVCQGQSSVTYTVPAITNATSYTWTLPTGATGTSTTNSISVDFGTSAVSGNVTVKGTNSCGDGAVSSLPITVNVKPATPAITLNGLVLQSDAPSGNQWYDQNGAITGATYQDYSYSANGDYYVIVTLLNCSSDPSNTITISNTGIESLYDNGVLKIYPNPVSNELVIESTTNSNNISFEILNSVGQKVYSGNVTDKTIVPTTDFAPGIYVLRLGNGKEFEFRKIVKE